MLEQSGRHAAVAVGDDFCMWMAAHAKTHPLLVATAKSEQNEPRRAIELWQLRCHAAAVFTRDQRTADALARVRGARPLRRQPADGHDPRAQAPPRECVLKSVET
jgi:hypothetical protein